MKKMAGLMLAAIILTVLAMPTQATGLLSYGGEEIIKVANFPDTEEFYHPNYGYMDAGYIYKQVSILYVPVWNYDGRWAGFVGDDGEYLELTKEELDEMAEQANVKLPNVPTLPFWEAIGGKLVFSLILLLYVGWKIFSSTFDDEKPSIA